MAGVEDAMAEAMAGLQAKAVMLALEAEAAIAAKEAKATGATGVAAGAVNELEDFTPPPPPTLRRSQDSAHHWAELEAALAPLGSWPSNHLKSTAYSLQILTPVNW